VFICWYWPPVGTFPWSRYALVCDRNVTLPPLAELRSNDHGHWRKSGQTTTGTGGITVKRPRTLAEIRSNDHGLVLTEFTPRQSIKKGHVIHWSVTRWNHVFYCSYLTIAGRARLGRLFTLCPVGRGPLGVSLHSLPRGRVDSQAFLCCLLTSANCMARRRRMSFMSLGWVGAALGWVGGAAA
jgi:hypothetical protein